MQDVTQDYEYDVFISYRHLEEDQRFVNKLVNQLREDDYRVAIDTDFAADETFEDEIARCISQSRYVLAVLSLQTADSNYSNEEMAITIVLNLTQRMPSDKTRHPKLIPLIIEKTESRNPLGSLSYLVAIDFTEDNQSFDFAYQRLKKNLDIPLSIIQSCQSQGTCIKAIKAVQSFGTIKIERKLDRSNLFLILIKTNRPQDITKWLKSSEAKKIRTQSRTDKTVSITEMYDLFGEYDLLLKVRATDVADELPVEEAIVQPLEERYKNYDDLWYSNILNVRFEYSLPLQETQFKVLDLKQYRAIKVFVYFTSILNTQDLDRILECCQTVVSLSKNSISINNSGSIIGVLNGLFATQSQILAEYIFPCGGYYDATDIILQIEDKLPHSIRKTTLFVISDWQGDDPLPT